MLPLLTTSGGTRRDPTWHLAVRALVAAEVPRELRHGERTDFHTISGRGAAR